MLCKMKSIIGNKLAFLYQLTKQNSVLASLHELTLYKTHYRRVVSFARSQKSHTYMLFQKFCLDWKLSPVINR